ncbi:SMT3 [Symbiodinium natans]|uniref:SMT3 protein n=1 Tax=Symbiodinium natans TaxID=878477 RepID=A0A812NMG6_9DINO|nr:SMT3 [Symbiodinium natans]
MHPGRTAANGDTLSRISEGSNEAGSVVSSYFSAISGAVGAGSAGRVGPADLLKAALRTPAKADKCAVRSSPSVTGSSGPEDQAALREVVKAFVEIGVRGRLVEALRGDGRAQPVVFRLSREVDAFEIGPEPGRGHRVALNEVSAVYTGSSERAKELTTMPGLDASCAVVHLADGRCCRGWGAGTG